MSYTALVLDQESRTTLLQKFLIPEKWETIAHHMTINMGEPNNGPAKEMVGETFKLKVVAKSMNSLVMAVKVETLCPSTNETKHITIAVNRKNGGKPFHSNELKFWNETDIFELSGKIEVCK